MNIHFLKKTISLLIILTVFSLTAYSTFRILDTGFESKTSNVKIVATLFKKQSTVALASTFWKQGEEGQIGMNTQINAICQKPLLIEDNNSLVDFLRTNQFDYSFTSRTEFASQAGITNYTGTAEQNAELRGYLISQNDKAALCT